MDKGGWVEGRHEGARGMGDSCVLVSLAQSQPHCNCAARRLSCWFNLVNSLWMEMVNVMEWAVEVDVNLMSDGYGYCSTV